MQIVIVDDEPLMLKRLANIVMKAEPTCRLETFGNAADALAFAKKNDVDVFFLDIRLPEMDGVTLARKIKVLQPRANVIFSTGYSEYMPEAFLLNVSGYLLKPITLKQVKEQLEILRYPVQRHEQNKVRLQCFGNFDVFYGNSSLRFRHSKTKELLAYLTLRRGASCTNQEILAALWEDGSHESYLRDLRKDLLSVLKEVGCEDIIEVKRGQMAIIPDRVDCDYFQWLDGIVSGINAYHGEFMSQYSWVEYVNASIQNSI